MSVPHPQASPSGAVAAELSARMGRLIESIDGRIAVLQSTAMAYQQRVNADGLDAGLRAAVQRQADELIEALRRYQLRAEGLSHAVSAFTRTRAAMDTAHAGLVTRALNG